MDTITAPPEEKTAKPKAGRDRSGSKRRTKAPRTKKIKASAEELLNYYRRMLLIRRFEEKAGQLYGMGLIAGFCHLYIGEEAVVVGMQAAMTPDDTMITAYRDHGHALACGMDPRGVMAELMGRAGGYSAGKGGSMHIFSAKDNFYGGHGIVGATVPLGTGLAFAHRYRGTPNVSLTFYGDGAANQGQVYEALNMAALWKLPVVYIIENNRYGMGTSVDRATANSDFYRRGELFGIPGKRVDGMDVLAVKAAGEIAVARCRAGKGPYILEMETYRYRGHSMSDPARYRTRDELNKVRDEHDAIDRLGQLLIDGGYADERQLRDIDKGVKKTVTEAVEHATNDPEPDASELYTDVLAALETFTPSQPKAAARVAPVDGEAAPPNGKTYGDTVTLTVREALRDAMAEEMRRDDSVFLLGEEVGEYQGAYKVSQGLLDEFGASRVIDTPITEQGFTGLGVGAAFAGLRPIVEFMTFNFAMQAMDQMVNSAAKTHYMSGGQMQCSLVFRGPNGAASRVGAQHSQCFASWFAHVPGFKVIAPYAADDAKGLLKSAIRDPNPVVFLENEMLYGRKFEVPDDPDFIVPIGQARVARPGTDVTITAFSLMVAHALDAAETLAAEGIDAEIIDLRTLRPLDITTIVASVQKTHRLVAVEEGWPYAGIAAEIAAMVMEHAFDQLDAPPARVTSADVPMAYAANLEALALPRPEDIVAAVKEVCYRA